ncbi:MAG: hypothetical protein KIT84_22875 [Labilithrix sp.]|nr:hypothetical protein [Labilithrix sp.]MCW5813890.1 hypothetical protein [Labilithrix sp.]
MRLRWFVAGLASVLALAGCKGGKKSEIATSITTTHAADYVLEPPAPGAIETVDVVSDRAVVVVAGDGEEARRPIVHLHGTCSEARTDIEGWSAVARGYGTIVALEGDTPCADGVGGRTWQSDAAALDQRVDAAIEAVRSVRGLPLDAGEVLVVADSAGALSALALAARAPAKYTRLVLIGIPATPPAYELDAVRAIAVLASDREPQDKARRAMESFAQARITTRLWTLAGASHGDYGLGGARTIGEALAFVTQR